MEECPVCFSKRDQHRPDLHVAWNYHRQNGTVCASCGNLWPCYTRIFWQREEHRAQAPKYAEDEYLFIGGVRNGMKLKVPPHMTTVRFAVPVEVTLEPTDAAPTTITFPVETYVLTQHATLGWAYVEEGLYRKSIPGYHYA